VATVTHSLSELGDKWITVDMMPYLQLTAGLSAYPHGRVGPFALTSEDAPD
jgi:hypothetical protein